MSARRSPWWWRETQAQALDAAEAVAVDYEVLPHVVHSEDAMKPGAPAVWDEVPDNIADRHLVRRSRGDRQGLRGGRSRGHEGLPYRPRHRRAARAARRGRALRRGERPLHALCRQRRRGAAEARALHHARHRARAAAGSVLRRRRQFRHPQPRLRRVRPGAVGGRTSSAGRSSTPRRARRRFSPTTRAAISSRGSSWRSPRTAASWRCAPPTSAMSARAACRCRRSSKGAGPDPGLLRHSGRDAARDGGLHQHDADPGLSQLGPARGHLRDRAADRQRGRAARLRPHRAAAQEPDQAEGDALPQRGRHALRQRPLRREHGLGDGDRRLEGFRRRAAARRRSAASCSAAASPTTSSPRSARRTSRRASRCGRRAASTW